MKLIFKENYLSIGPFDSIDLPDFTVLTGINGAGKSHLLESIQQKKVQIEGIESTNIVYFNNESFRLENEQEFNPYNIIAERENAWNFFNQQIKDIISTNKMRFLKENYKNLVDKCEKKGNNLWGLSREDINDDNLYEQIKQYRQNIEIFFNNPQLKENPQAQATLTLIKELKYSIDEIQKKEFLSLYKPFHFKSNFLPQQLGKIICDYYTKFRDNKINKYEIDENGTNYPFIPEDEFIKINGDKPWVTINKILASFNNLDYKVNSPEGSSSVNSFQLKLIHNSKKIEINFENLSSGEKILMALVASIYKDQSDKNFPDVLLLDEIDASLHPSMIKNLLKVINDIFLKRNMKIILVTHSPTTIAIAPDDSIFVMNKMGENRIEKKTKEDALAILTEGFVSLTQKESLLSISYNLSKARSLIVLTEGITDKIILETAWNKLFTNMEMPFYIQDCFDAGFLRNLMMRGSSPPDGIFSTYNDKKFIAIFDFDEQGYNEWNQLKDNYSIIVSDPQKGLAKKHNKYDAFCLLLPVTNNIEIKNQVIKDGNDTYKDKSHFPIELMFYGAPSLDKNFRLEKIVGGGEIIKFIGDKRKFAESCKYLQSEDFENFRILFNILTAIHTGIPL